MTTPSATAIVSAQAAQRQFPTVFAPISLAQWALESGWGSKMSGLNNPFGIKAAYGQSGTEVATHEYVSGRYVPTVSYFANYPDLQSAFIAHAALLAVHPQYHAFQAAATVQGKCMALNGVYATDPQYGQKLWALILSEGFIKYDISLQPSAPAVASDARAPAHDPVGDQP